MKSQVQNLPCIFKAARRAAFVLCGSSALLFSFTARAQSGTALVRHAPVINSASVSGSIQQMSAESATLNGGASVSGDLLVPGTPTVMLNGQPSYAGTLDGSGSASPSNYQIILNGNASLRHVIRRTDPIPLPTVSAPPAPTGTQDVVVNSAGQSINFATLRNLTLNGNAGQIAVPPGTYGSFIANSNSGFTLGVAGSTQPAVYNLQSLTLNSGSQVQIVGPVILTLANGATLNGSMGNAGQPFWLTLDIASGGLTLNSGAALYGSLTAPAGTVILNGNTRLLGALVADRLTLNGNCQLSLDAPPTVSLTAPANGSVFTAPASFTLTAAASDSDGTITKVDFYQNGSLIGTDTSAPYQFSVSSLAAGTYTFTAVATDNLGATATSAPITVISNAPPTVSLTAPADGSVFTAPASFTLTASASDSDGTVTQVDFYQGTTLLGTATSAPFEFNISNLAAGTYSFTAVATDNFGATTTSAAISIKSNAPPSVALTAPTDGAVFLAPADITLQASASDSDGTVAKVDFYQGATLIGTSTTAPYQLSISSLPAGAYTFTAIATDNDGAATNSATISIKVNAPPTVSITSPANNSIFTAPASFALSANAADSDGTIAKVDFFKNGALVGTSTSAPYQVSISGLAAGNYTFTAAATDNDGATTTSAEVSITVNSPPTVAITSPANGASFVALASFTVTANAADSDGSVVKVDFYRGATLIGTSTTAPYHVNVSDLDVGSYTFTAVATDDDGASTTSAPITVSVNPNQPPTVSLTSPADGSTFTAPASFTLVAAASDSDGSVAHVDFYQGATLLGSATTAPYQFSVSNLAAGNYIYTAIATDNLGATATSAPVNVTVNNPVPATINFDSVSSVAMTAAGTTLTWNHTLNTGADTRGIVVSVAARNSSSTGDTTGITSVTFNGVPMLAVPGTDVQTGTVGTFNHTRQFYLLDSGLPATPGTYPIVVTFAQQQTSSNFPIAAAVALTNVAQSQPAGFNNKSTSGTSMTTTVPASVGSWVVDIFDITSSGANLNTANANMVKRWGTVQATNIGGAGATQIAGSGGTVSMSWTNNSARENHSLTVFSPALITPTAPSITTQPQSQTINVGDSATFSVVATGSAPLSYQWFKNSLPISGATSTSFSISNAQTTDSGNYTVTVTNSAGSTTSNTAVLTVNYVNPSITTQPQSQTVNQGDPATFTVAATGTAPLSYQWFKNGSPISGATSSTFTIASTIGADSGNYTVTVSNAGGSATSDPATLTVNTGPVAPTITTQPFSQTVGATQTVTFSVTAAGTAPLSYQWFKNSSAISGATASSFTIASAQSSDAGSYYVTVTNNVGSVTSNTVTLTVNPLTTPSALYNLTGFATVGSGCTGGGVIPDTDPAYVKVFSALDLANALIKASKTAGSVKVIEIMHDLDLGWNEVGSTVQNLASTPFRSHTTPLLHPVLLQTGLSLIDVKPLSGLTIFSSGGATIRHANLNIKSTSNIIVRNLKFDQNWEWDEATRGNYDRNDWDFITLGNGGAINNIWIDHCTFTKSYDGVVDMKAGCSNLTLSWCNYIGDDGATNPNSWVRQQFAALETNLSAYPMYGFFRTHGFSLEDMVAVVQGHDKAHLLGQNDFDPNNATLTATFHHDWFKNLWDRCVPRLRAGNVHDYNIYVDDTNLLNARLMRDARIAAMSAADQNTANNTYSFKPALNGSISTEGGALLVEKSDYINCRWVLRNNQTDPSNPAYTGKIEAIDTIFHSDDPFLTTTDFPSPVSSVPFDFRGDSTDPNSHMGPYQAPIIPFSWNLSGNVLPYTYTPDDPANLLPLMQAGAGAGVISWDKSNWLKTSY